MENITESADSLNLVDEGESEATNSFNEIHIEGSRVEVEEPIVGKTFATVDDMYSFYMEYARQTEFPFLRRSTKRGSGGEIKYVTFTCARGGKLRSASKNLLKRRPTTKTNCQARLVGSLDEDVLWKINYVDLEHNHTLSPSKSRLFRCNQKIANHVKRRLEINDMEGIRLKKNFTSLVVEAGGHENVPFLEMDCRNYMQTVRRLQLAEGDAIAIKKNLKMQAENLNFFFSKDLDDEGQLKNVFWADARSRVAYKEFGQVVNFDTTYLTNKYDMPFAPFVGVNHHGQSTLFGCALVSSEDTETFVWLFRTWLACMSDCAPHSIITDQDKAMQKAIEIVFPNTRHRWCLWHIMKNIPEKLGSYKKDETISSSLKDAVYDSESLEEFEQK